MSDTSAPPLHASCVAWQARGLLITGPSGSGKSTLALSLMALGCALVADDRTVLHADGDAVIAQPHGRIDGMIEARGIGILRATSHGPVALAGVVDLAQTETQRIPPRRFTTLMGHDLPLIWRVDGPHWVPSLLQWLKYGWSDQ